MSAKVIVVHRPRRNVFAVPRALFDWLRSAWALFFRTSVRDVDIPEAKPAAARSMSFPLFPRLAFDSSGVHRCVGCDLCVRVCPSRCLSLATRGEGAGLQVTRFDLVRGACIGCGFCAEACPEDAIEMVADRRVELAPRTGRPIVADLLIGPSTIRSAIRSTRRG